MPILVAQFTGGPLDTHCYLALDDESRLAIIVDAPWNVHTQVIPEVQRRSVQPLLIVITHGHWDHVADAGELRNATGAPVAAHPLEVPLLEAPAATLYDVPFEIPAIRPEMLLKDGSILDVGALHFHVLHTPGHTPGSLCLYEPDNKLLFSGDTLFHRGYGRTDLPGASDEQMWKSLAALSTLPEDVQILPGHGPRSAIGQEAWLKRIPAEL